MRVSRIGTIAGRGKVPNVYSRFRSSKLGKTRTVLEMEGVGMRAERGAYLLVFEEGFPYIRNEAVRTATCSLITYVKGLFGNTHQSPLQEDPVAIISGISLPSSSQPGRVGTIVRRLEGALHPCASQG